MVGYEDSRLLDVRKLRFTFVEDHISFHVV